MNKFDAALLAACLCATAGVHAAGETNKDMARDAALLKKEAAEEKEDTKKLAAMGKDEMGNDATCWVPCDHVPVRSWPLFRARELMRGVIESFHREHRP